MALTCTIVNESSEAINNINGWELIMNYLPKKKLEGDDPYSEENKWNWTMTNMKCVMPESSTQIVLPTSNSAVAWMIKMDKRGYKFGPETDLYDQDESSSQCAIAKPGSVIRILMDETNPPLSPSEEEKLVSLMFEELENWTDYDSVWDNVYNKATDIVKGRSLEQLEEVFTGNTSWNPPARGIWVEDWASIDMIKKALVPGRPTRIDLYWRCLGRFPGGNADIHTICYTINLSERRVSCREYSNWDGSHNREEWIPKGISQALETDSCRAGKDHEEVKGTDIGTLLTSLKSLSHRESRCTLIDRSDDSEEYDSEWTSQEVIVYIPRPWTANSHAFFDDLTRNAIYIFLMGNNRLPKVAQLDQDLRFIVLQYLVPTEYVPVQRLERCSVPDRLVKSYPEEHVPPNPEQLAVLDASSHMIGMGRVNEFTDAGDGEESCFAAVDVKVDLICEGDSNYLPYVQPVYFRNTARAFCH